MNKVLAVLMAFLIFSVAFSACSPVSIGIQLPGGPDQGRHQEDMTALLYVLIVIAGVAAVIALVSGVSRH